MLAISLYKLLEHITVSIYGYHLFMCRWFALMEMHLVVAMVIHMMDLKMLDLVPEPVSALIVEILNHS